MATAKLMLRRGKAKDKIKAIVLCISHKGKNTEISLKKSVHIDYWDKDAQDRVKKGCPQYDNIRTINNYINNELAKAWECIERLEKSRKIQNMTVSDISSYIKDNDNSGNYIINTNVSNDGENVDFIEYFNHYLTFLDNPKSRRVYGDTLKAIKRYIGEGNTLFFNEVNASWINRFKSFRQSEVAMSTTSLSLMVLKAVFNYAIDIDEVIPQSLYPFRKFKIPKIKPRNLRLPIEVIRAIRDAKTTTERQELAKDFFMLSFYLIGMNNSDIYDLDSIVSGRVEYYRNKTSKPYSIKIEPEAMEIFERRKGIQKLLVYQERYSTVKTLQTKIGLSLKEIGNNVGVPNLIMYNARHSWAGIAAKKPIGAGKPLIAQALGHGAKTVTDTYFDYDNELVDDLNRKIIDLLNKKEE